MATRKTTSSKKKQAGAEQDEAAAPVSVSQAYETALTEFSEALQRMHAGDFGSARQGFQKIAQTYSNEAVLVERARSYARHCERKLAPPDPPPETPDDLYYRAVFHTNNGDAEAALTLIDKALQLEPESARLLYAKAAASAIKGDADSAVGQLRRAIAVDPQVRFQAGNDPDFELIREEPAFIDIIEPTPTGA